MTEEKIEFGTLPQDLQARLVRKLIEEYQYSYGVAAYILVGDRKRRGLISAICRKNKIHASSHQPGFKHLRKGYGGVVLRLEEQKFPTLKEFLQEIETDIKIDAAWLTEPPPPETPHPPSVPETPERKKYKPPPPGVGLRKLTTLEAHQCEAVFEDRTRCGVEKAPGSRFCHWHQPL